MSAKCILLLAVLEVFAIQVLTADVKTLYTNGYYYSQYFPLEENMAAEKTLRFSVRAPRDAHILLAPSHQADGPVYEVVLGAHDNTVNYIRGRCPCQEEPSATIRTVNLLSATEFRNFWIRIKSDSRRTFIQVGMGGKDAPFHEWRDPRPLNPQYLSFRSGTAAEWKFGFNDDYVTGVTRDRRQTVVTSTGFGQYYPLSDAVSHSDDAVTLYFTVRTPKEFQILLTPAVSSLGDAYEIGISDRGAYIRRRHLGDNKAAYMQEGFLNERDRIRYWIKVSRDGLISVGKGGSTTALLSWRDPNPISPQFLSFTLHRARGEDPDASSSADVQFSLGPNYSLESQDCRPRWKQAIAGRLPAGSLRGGRNEQDELFVCRANHDGQVIPGNFVPNKSQKGECIISSNLFVYQKTEFDILTGCRFNWTSATLGGVPSGAISTGEVSGNKKLYVARVAHERQVVVGKLRPDHRITYIPFNGQELPFTNYEVLTYGTARGTTSTGQSNDPPPLIG